jgi:hypothetical protein
MDFNLEALLWYILATDCSFAFTVSWFLKDWYDSSVPSIAKHFPATKGWSIVYLSPYPVVRFCTYAGRRPALVKSP